MRILLITDSLGLPRKLVKYEDVWTDRLLKRIKLDEDNSLIVYTMLKRALTIDQVWQMKTDIGYLSPDIIIFQFGVVDSVRRVMPRKTEEILSKFRIGRWGIRFTRKHSSVFTRLYCIRYNSPKNFEKYLKKLIDWLEARPRFYTFIKIAPPGDNLLSRIYNAKDDINLYNDILLRHIRGSGSLLDPYAGEEIEKFILKEDGHHLTSYGNQLVYNSVWNYINEKRLTLE